LIENKIYLFITLIDGRLLINTSTKGLNFSLTNAESGIGKFWSFLNRYGRFEVDGRKEWVGGFGMKREVDRVERMKGFDR